MDSESRLVRLQMREDVLNGEVNQEDEQRIKDTSYKILKGIRK